jgi:hypothetical protein
MKLSGSRHAHGCKRCAIRYEDACTDPLTNGPCTSCRGGRAWQLLIENALPQQCCLEHSRLATKDERETYRLAGSTLWWICSRCAPTRSSPIPNE